MLDSPTILRRRGSSEAGRPSAEESDPLLVSGIRRRVAALAALVAVAYSVVVPLDLAMHASFDTTGLTSPARLKNVGMAVLMGWVYFYARRESLSLRRLTGLAYLMVFMLGLHQALESLHFFQWPDFWPSYELAPEWAQPSLVEGVPWTCVLLVLFPPFVPGSPLRHSILAVVIAGQLVALSAGWAILGGPGLWTILSPDAFAALLICVALSLFISVAIHRVDTALRTERRRSRELGSYELIRELGQGAMGEVWQARHRLLIRPAAIKLIKPDMLADGDPDRSGRLIERFAREAQATASLQSPHSVELYDFGTSEDGTFYIVMELLRGIDLESLVKRFGPLPAERAVDLLIQTCDSLDDAHRHGLVHRDVKPANLFLTRKGRRFDYVKVMDFGLVKGVEAGVGMDEVRATVEGEVLGTPAYMAPEVVTGATVDARSDIYALGCVAYWLLTGELVFESSGSMNMLIAHAKEEPLPPSDRIDSAIPESLDDIVMACLEKDPARRPQTAWSLAKQLESCELPERWSDARAEEWWEHNAPETHTEVSTREATRTGPAVPGQPA